MKENVLPVEGEKQVMTETYSDISRRNVLPMREANFQCEIEQKKSSKTEALQGMNHNDTSANMHLKEVDIIFPFVSQKNCIVERVVAALK